MTAAICVLISCLLGAANLLPRHGFNYAVAGWCFGIAFAISMGSL